MVYITSITVLVGKLGGHCFFCSDVSIQAMALETSHLLQRFPEKVLLQENIELNRSFLIDKIDSALEDESTMSIAALSFCDMLSLRVKQQ